MDVNAIAKGKEGALIPTRMATTSNGDDAAGGETAADGAGFVLVPTGDAIVNRPVGVLEGRSARFDAVLEALRAADATLTNLEQVITDGDDYATPPAPVPDHFQYLSAFPGMVMRSDPSMLDELTAMGVDAVSAANNHSLDFGRRGMERTMAALEAREVPYAGLGRHLPAARSPAYLSTAAGRVGLVHATTSVPPGGDAGPPAAHLPGRPGINPLHVRWRYHVPPDRLEALRELAEVVGIEDVKGTWLSREDRSSLPEEAYAFMHMTFLPTGPSEEPRIELSLDPDDRRAYLESVREADRQADWVVASVHSHQGPGGTRNVQRTPGYLERFARSCIDAGADAFVCTGPHVLRGVEVYGDRPIFYSLGNFICQIETQELLPAEAYDFYGVEGDDRPSRLMDTRYLEEGEPRGNLAYPAYWRTVVPTCRFRDDGGLDRIELLPCSLGRGRSRGRRGTPLRARPAQAGRILDDLAARSRPYGTSIGREATDDGPVGVIDPDACE